MKNFTFLKETFACLLFILSSAAFSQVTVADYNFNTDEQGWTLGSDAGRGGSTSLSCDGSSGHLYVVDDKNSSIITSPGLDLTPYDTIDISFCFITGGLENNEGFILQYYDGSSWTNIKTFSRGTDFSNNGTFYYASETITSGTYTFDTNSQFRFRGDANKNNEYNRFDNILIEGYIPQPEIDVLGLGNSIADGDVTPSAVDNTSYGTVGVSTTTTHTFTIENTSNPSTTLTISNSGTGITITGGSGYFSINTEPAQNSTISGGSSLNFSIDYTPLAAGTHTATVTIDNDDGNGDEIPYNFTISGTATIPSPEINVQGNALNITHTDSTPVITDGTDFGSTDVSLGVTHTFTIENLNTATTALSVGAISFTGSNPGDFAVTTAPSGSVAIGASTTFDVTFTPSAAGIRSAIINIANNDSDENPYQFTLQGNGIPPLLEGPGGVTSHLKLWLKGTDGLGYSDGNAVSTWYDQGRGSDATVNTAGQEPTYYDNPTRNVNFNPVVEFDNTFSSFSLDGDYSYDNTSTQFLEGSSGLYTQDMFVVLIPDDTVINDSFGFMDTFCGDADIATNETDATGIGMGDYTGRVDNESICFALGTYSTSESNDGYAVYDQNTSYDNVGIINARNNVAVTQQELYYNANNIEYAQNDVAEFLNVSDSRYWIGRSEGWEATLNARMCEIITFSARKNDTDLTQERNRIQSYLAIKYGITLGANGTSQDYVDSAGNVIWDVDTGTPAEDVFNYDIAGIGRDDDSDLLQKQSRSVNNALDGATRGQGVLTIGIGSIANTNNLNTSTDLEDKEYLVWGNNGVDLDDPSVDVEVNMSTDISPSLTTNVQFYGIARTWKVVENVGPGGDIPSVEVAVLTSAIRTATPPDGRYLMFISDTPNFDPTADYRVMTEGTNELGEAIVKTNYDFDGTKYITFGWAPELVFERSIYFNGTTSYVDMEDALDLNPTEFTISAWVKADTNADNKSILSKRDASFTEGYDFKINSTGKFEVSWKTSSGSIQTTTSNTTIPKNEWHHLAVTYGASLVRIYIDGVLDKQINRTAPNDTNQSFFIGAASKLSPQAFFHGNIDEVRIWDVRLTEDQLRYIMNQEIEDNASFVGGSYFIAQGASPTKDEIGTIPWSDLIGYYPMSTYTYTNTKDESGNGNQGALRTLRTVDRQTAPLPYQSANNGDWDTDSVWSNGSVQAKPGANSIVDNTVTVDWNIVETNHNITMDNSGLAAGNNGNRNVLALFVESNELTVDGDNSTDTGYGLTITHFLNLDGKIDLEGESQLIQTTDSDLVLGGSGELEKDQQGTQDLYTYNYWSSPVGFTATGTPNNYKYTLNNNILRDGTTSSSPANITFVGGYDGDNSGSNIEIAHYWIWKFNNRLSDDYASWQHVRNTGEILAGEGFTMKGVNDTGGNVSDEQNYVFQGKPNNGKVSLGINNGNEYLVGNPYASAIDAEQFITDNGPTIDGGVNPMVDDPLISGTLYFWEHWGGGSHILAEYQGGYGTYNFSGGAPAAAWGTPDPDVAQVGTGTKTPGRYIPVGQGFFVTAEDDGNIEFNNGQRVFQKEGTASSVFMRDSNTASRTNHVDNRMKIRLGFNSVNTIHRQLLVTVDDRASENYDWGFDAKLNELQIDDMYWMINNDKYVVQGIDNISDHTILPIGIHTDDDGINKITIDILENVPSDLNIYAHDKVLNVYQDLRERDYEIFLEAGEYLDRFEITFTTQSLGVDEFEASDALQVYFVNSNTSIVIQNPKLVDLKSAEMFNMLGQSITRFNEIETKNHVELKTNSLSTGTYIINLKTTEGATITKKVLVK
ncbi:LamG-like jellyroll fold domain-containing protein [Hanstruepera flava]|uniref:LamG-like jellyroll fold domain-containing protein n=1 Tax=Hanstruepera flava TaxID=2930218 RepID=UPI0020282B3D|nr:LamG-like jellyroll fold domain-containing protein [Hanstruepera flava]